MPFNPFTVLTSKIFGALAIALALALAFAWARGNGYRAERDKAREQVASWQAANKAATEWAQREKAAKEAAANATKEKADVERKADQAAGDALARDYAARNKCVRVEAASGGVRADLPRPAAPAGKPAPVAADAFVAVSDADFRQCTVNSLDLLNAAQTAADWRAKGLAE